MRVRCNARCALCVCFSQILSAAAWLSVAMCSGYARAEATHLFGTKDTLLHPCFSVYGCVPICSFACLLIARLMPH